MNDQPPTGSPPAEAAAPAAPSTLKTAAVAAAATAITIAVAAAGYRFYVEQQVDAVADALTARAYAEVTAKPQSPAAATPGGEHTKPRDIVAATKPAAASEPGPRTRVAPRSAQAERPRRPPSRTPVARSGGTAGNLGGSSPARAIDVDGIYNARAARECARGFVGMICREWLKASLCWKHHAFGKASVCPEERPVREFWSENSNTA